MLLVGFALPTAMSKEDWGGLDWQIANGQPPGNPDEIANTLRHELPRSALGSGAIAINRSLRRALGEAHGPSHNRRSRRT